LYVANRSVIKALEDYIAQCKKVAVAYSGGVDSTFLLATSARVLDKRNILALSIQSPLIPPWELDFAREFCRSTGIRHLLLDGSFAFDDQRIAANPQQRCYYCKRRIFEVMQRENPDNHPLLTGTNASDEACIRPGIRAEEEMGVLAPLRELGFTKDTIREYSRIYEIPGSERPASPCFATRIPYGEPITVEKIRMIEKAEAFLHHLRFSLVRVRLLSGDTACLEVAPEQIMRACDLHHDISYRLGSMGFKRVVLDLEGYREGKLNSTIA
jgi:uncharacterized protein